MIATVQLATGYNLFRRRHEPGLCCAVRHDKPVPSFVESAEWEFAGTVYDDGPMPVPVGFKLRAARQATVVNGYYVFHTTGRLVRH